MTRPIFRMYIHLVYEVLLQVANIRSLAKVIIASLSGLPMQRLN